MYYYYINNTETKILRYSVRPNHFHCNTCERDGQRFSEIFATRMGSGWRRVVLLSQCDRAWREICLDGHAICRDSTAIHYVTIFMHHKTPAVNGNRRWTYFRQFLVPGNEIFFSRTILNDSQSLGSCRKFLVGTSSSSSSATARVVVVRSKHTRYQPSQREFRTTITRYFTAWFYFIFAFFFPLTPFPSFSLSHTHTHFLSRSLVRYCSYSFLAPHSCSLSLSRSLFSPGVLRVFVPLPVYSV